MAASTARSGRSETEDAAMDEIDFTCAKILIVDDIAPNRELLEAYLDALPCEVRMASDGVEAIEEVEREEPDLILLDIMMPKMSGFEVCEKLKADPRKRNIPIIMVTALNEVGDVERGVEAGTDDFISKPFNKLELITRVKSLLRLRLMKQQLDQAHLYIEPERKPNLDEQTSPGD